MTEKSGSDIISKLPFSLRTKLQNETLGVFKNFFHDLELASLDSFASLAALSKRLGALSPVIKAISENTYGMILNYPKLANDAHCATDRAWRHKVVSSPDVMK